MNLFRKTLSVFMVILTLFTMCSVVMPVVAAEDSLLSTDDILLTDTENKLSTEDSPEAKIVSEIIENRDETTKQFLLSDGSFKIAQYNNPVHYQNEDGDWIDIDNTITKTEATTEQTELFGTSELYATNKAVDNVVFAEKSNSNTLVSFEAEDFPISLNYQSAKKSYIKIVEKSNEYEGDEAFLILSNVKQEVLYENVFTDVDLQYIVSPSELKENIILKSRNADNTFTVNYNIGSLSAEVVDEHTINLMSGDTVVYTISAPYMYDENHNISRNVSMSVEKNKNGKLTINLTADESWIKADERSFPVVIDPAITTETEREAIDSVMISKAMGTTNFSDQAEMIVGRESSSYSYCRVLVAIDLPKLGKGDMIVDAELNIVNYDLDYYADTTPDMQVNAHVVTSDWNMSTVTWNTQPSFSSVISDYEIFEKLGDSAEFRKFNISAIAKQWYEDPDTNKGILLKSANESGDYAENGVKADMYTERYNTVQDAYPQIVLTYRNNKGLEDYWTYTTVSAGTAGTAYINDYTGNLVFVHGDVSTTGMFMPISLEHVYNGYMAKKNASSYPHSGRGFKLNLQQTVTETNLTNFPYAYEDGDGTVHYFYKKTTDGVTQYLDEDGLNLELKDLGDNGYTITDKSDNVMSFGKGGKLTAITDAEGRQAKLSYTTAKNSAGTDVKYVNKITDGSGHVITLTYSSGEGNSSQISKITGPDGKYITYTTSAGLLNKITYPDGTYSTYTYDDDGSMLTAKSADGYMLTFTYADINGGKRVATVTESNGSSNGQKIVFERKKINQTVIRTSGKDAVSGNDDDILTTYQFDNFGRTVSTKSKLASGTSLGVENYSYTANTDNSKLRNRVTSAAATGKNVNNLLTNHSFEGSAGWTKGGIYKTIDDTSVANAQFVSTASYSGAKSMKVQFNTCTQKSGYGMTQAMSSTLSPGSTYTLSAYVKTDGITQAVSGIEGGACVAMRFAHTDGSSNYVFSRMITSTDSGVDNGWQRVFLTFTVPEDTESSRVVLMLYCATGVAYFDCVQLEKNNTVNSYNYLENSSFEKDAASWSGVNTTSSDSVSTSTDNTGSKSYKITGQATKTKHIRQDIPVSGKEEDTYILSGYAKANSVPFDKSSSDHVFELAVRIVYSDGKELVKTPAKFNHAVTDWQHTTGAFTLSDDDASTTRKPVTLKVYCIYYNQVNSVYFDDISLVKEPVPTYTYDKEGNLISATENAESTSALQYDSNDNLTSFANEKKAQFTYEYASSGNKHRLLKAVDKTAKVTYAYSYYDTGNFKSQDIKNSSGTYDIRSGTTYSAAKDGISAGAYVKEQKDQHGYATTYDYNVKSGLLNSVTDAQGYVTSYTYNANNGLLTKVASGTKSVNYTYNSSNTALSKITHNGFDYTFTYDHFGNVLTTKAAGTTLMTNTYQANNGSLLKSTYGNGDYKDYSYDSVGRTTLVKNNGSNAYYWRYNANGDVGLHTDYVTNRDYYYTYDSLGRVVEELGKTRGTESYSFESDYVYDVSNNLTKVVNRVDDLTMYTKYAYDNINRPTKTTLNSSVNFTYAYDSLGRHNYKYLNGTEGTVTIDYDFANSKTRAATDTVTYKTTQISKEKIDNRAYSYTYGKRGNITEIKEKPATSSTYGAKVTYTYDQWGQLTRENNLDLNKTIVYTYDAGGNITKRTEYPYTTGTVGTATKTVNYTYDTAWKDKLTSYDGDAITYDAIGNPLTYRDGMSFTWQGRQMKTANLNGTSVSYKYNADGLRTYKKVGSTVHEYEYSGGKLYYEKRGDLRLYFRYDAMGNLAAITRLKANGEKATLYVICNSRGDVEEIRKSTGELLARYVYDSWGNVVHIYDVNGAEITSPNNIALQNPIRYRGYYFDAESGLYYLQSRYYDPVTCRFLNADSIVDSSDILGFNMFAYCGNNPVARADTGGQFWDTVFDIASVVYSAVQVCLAPTVASNWLSLGADLVSLVVPFASGGGAAVRALSKADDIYDAAKTIDNFGDVADATVDVARAVDNTAETVNVGWHVGDDITNLTKAGNEPSWSTVRQRYWKNEARYHPELYEKDLERLKKGLAPIGEDGFSMELHHPNGREGTNFYIFEPLTRTKHREKHYG